MFIEILMIYCLMGSITILIGFLLTLLLLDIYNIIFNYRGYNGFDWVIKGVEAIRKMIRQISTKNKR